MLFIRVAIPACNGILVSKYVSLFVTLQMICDRKRKRDEGLDGEDNNIQSNIKRRRCSDASYDSDFVDHSDASASAW